MPEPIKIKRTLYIGLGGTGAKAILKAKKCFVDAYGEVPPMVAFLAIDTDNAISESAEYSRRGEKIRLDDNEIALCGISGSALDIFKQNLQSYTWLPSGNERFLGGLANNGAGQIRSNGRFLIRHNAKTLSTKIAQRVTKIGEPLPRKCQFTYDTNKDGVEFPTYIHIVGSVAGGTGGGTLIDAIILASKVTPKETVIYPWILLPDIYKYNYPGPLSDNVLQNAYAALRELDYLYHLSIDNHTPIDFLFDKITHMPEKIGKTYLINMKNRVGISYQTPNDMADSIGRCLFIEGNKYSSDTGSALDNLQHGKFNFNVRNKEAHYVSAGSAELIYDNQAVGNSYAATIIANLCDSLLEADEASAIAQAMKWTMSDSVRIQEHNADQLTDDLLQKRPGYALAIGRDTTETEIKAFINACTSTDTVLSQLKDAKENKLSVVKEQLEQEIKSIIDTQGIGSAIAFLNALTINIQLCDKEMQDELKTLQERLSIPENWSTRLSDLWTDFYIYRHFNHAAADLLAEDILENHIGVKRDELRHNKAIDFYDGLKKYIDGLLNDLTMMQQHLSNIKSSQLQKIEGLQNRAVTTSQFQIYLHGEDILNTPKCDISALKQGFLANNEFSSLIGCNQEMLYSRLWKFAKEQNIVKSAVNVSVNDVLSNMPEDQVREIFSRLKNMASPLWNTDLLGYVDHEQTPTSIFLIGTEKREEGVIQSKYSELFTIGTNSPVFAETAQTDRIILFQLEAYSPLYSIANFTSYKEDAEEKEEKRRRDGNTYPAAYLDEQWHQRMESEGFDIMPKDEEDTILPNWVNAIVYGYVKFDVDKDVYYINSTTKGNPRKGGFVALGNRRDLAFEAFRLNGFAAEVQDRLRKEIDEKGQPAVAAIMREVKNNLGEYDNRYAQLSPIELNRVNAEDEAYSRVIKLLDDEAEYIANLQF